jgi:glycosyltransferase involved in cell wall biosynthesis
MATKNGATFIEEQLASILAQLTPTDEVVISDDYSHDDTLTVIRSFQDSRIRLLESRSEKGIAKNFEASITASHGDFIFLSDQDDIWLANKVDKMKEALNKYDLVMSDCQVIDEEERVKEISCYRLNRSGKGVLKNLLKNSYMGCCMAFRSHLKKRALPFPSDIPMHDIWLGLIAEMYYSVHFMPDILLSYRRHGGNVSTTGGVSTLSMTRKLTDRCNLIKNLFIHRYHAR